MAAHGHPGTGAGSWSEGCLGFVEQKHACSIRTEVIIFWRDIKVLATPKGGFAEWDS